MFKELRVYRLTENIITYSDGAIQYKDAKAIATKYCNNRKSKLFNFTHVGDDSFAWSVAQRYKSGANVLLHD